MSQTTVETFQVILPEELLPKSPRAGRPCVEPPSPRAEPSAPLAVAPSGPPTSKFERERRAFFRLLPGLLKTHPGQYVAVHGEQVVDSGPDGDELAVRVLRRVRDDIYVGLVAAGPEPVVRAGRAPGLPSAGPGG